MKPQVLGSWCGLTRGGDTVQIHQAIEKKGDPFIAANLSFGSDRLADLKWKAWQDTFTRRGSWVRGTIRGGWRYAWDSCMVISQTRHTINCGIFSPLEWIHAVVDFSICNPDLHIYKIMCCLTREVNTHHQYVW